jgi:Tfp pilus assembly protein PilF
LALHFPRGNALLLLTPKTGSTWIRAKVRELGIPVREVGDPAMRDHDLLAQFDRSRYRMTGAFVRDPVEWYRSYWAYRLERGWRPRYALDKRCASDDFTTFVRTAAVTMPGALGSIYASYTGPSDDPVDFVGRQERLAADFAKFLRLAGEPAGVAETVALERGSLVNATTTRPDFSDELKELLTISEWDAMARYGYMASHPDPYGLAEIQERYPEHAGDLRMLALWTARTHWAADDRKRQAGHQVRAQTRYARVHGNFALFAQSRMHDPDYAERRYLTALELDPAHPRTLCNYALLRWRHGQDPGAARTLMLRALAARPDHPYTLGKLADLTDRELADPELAAVLYRQSLAAAPEQPQPRAALALLLIRQGKAAQAVELVEPHAERQDAGRLILLTYASALLAAGRGPDEAAAARRRAQALPTTQKEEHALAQ